MKKEIFSVFSNFKKRVLYKIEDCLPYGKLKESLYNLKACPYVLFTSSQEEFLNKKATLKSYFWTNAATWDYTKLYPKRTKIQMDFLLQNFIPFLKKDFIMADLGCASGVYSFMFSKYVKQIDAFDLSKQMIEHAKQRARLENVSNINFFQTDFTKVRLNKKYDVILMLGLLTCIFDKTIIEDIIDNIYNSIFSSGGGLSY
jgi:2-polyprenyl-3-methyl-5-hydroxy-6-metoxy-1,4-benzoquinol methylase